ncbi:MAG: hypothetical protein IH933_11930, partial [Euryarchaeota archaeon]|nr:hypothetical protein [Euryarchaeota archaeon]
HALLTALICAFDEGASVEILGHSTGFAPPQFQLFALLVLGVGLVMVAFTIVLVAPTTSSRVVSSSAQSPAVSHLTSSSPACAAPLPPLAPTAIADGEGKNKDEDARDDNATADSPDTVEGSGGDR